MPERNAKERTALESELLARFHSLRPDTQESLLWLVRSLSRMTSASGGGGQRASLTSSAHRRQHRRHRGHLPARVALPFERRDRGFEDRPGALNYIRLVEHPASVGQRFHGPAREPEIQQIPHDGLDR